LVMPVLVHGEHEYAHGWVQNDPVLIEAHRKLCAEESELSRDPSWEYECQRIVDAAPKLTAAQRDKLATLLVVDKPAKPVPRKAQARRQSRRGAA
jgi:hypothetical protein